MIKKIIGFVILMILTSILPESKALANKSVPEAVQLRGAPSSEGAKVKKRRLKKTVRKAARVYRKFQDNRDSKKKSRKVQRKVQRIINIF